MSKVYLYSADDEVKMEQEPVAVVGVPYVDDNMTLRNDLLFYEATNGCRMVCGDGALYDNAVVRADSGLRFWETDVPIEIAEDPQEGEQDNADSGNDM